MSKITLQQLCSYLDALLNCSEFSDYCPNGLQIQGKENVETLATAVSASLETIQRAVDEGVDALIVHHGIFWKGDPYPIVGVKKEKVALLLEHGISLLAYHLPLDAHELYGNNWKAAGDLGWEDLRPCAVINGIPIGVMGRFSPMSREAFQKKIQDYYDHDAHCAPGGKETVSSAYLISGGAYKYLNDAAALGADCFVTGNFDEPAWHDAHEKGINFYACGHSATERIGPKALSRHIGENFDLKEIFLDIYNPF